jgi:hypothetical protein
MKTQRPECKGVCVRVMAGSCASNFVQRIRDVIQ